MIEYAVSMANYVLRTVPPSLTDNYAQSYDKGVWLATSQDYR